MNNTSNPRLQGVIGNTPTRVYGEPKTLVHIQPLQMFALEYFGDKGEKITTVAFKLGDQLFLDPQGEAWASRLRPIDKNTWLYKQAEAKFNEFAARTQVKVSKEDAVDVVEGAP